MNIVVRSVAEQAYAFVRERILSGEFAAGMPIRQDGIALDLGISKIPLREALTRLEEDGLVASHPNRGYIVSLLSAAEAQEVFLLRLKLEPDATAQGALAARPADRFAAEEALAQLEAALTQSGSFFVALNRVFHMSLIRPGVGKVTYHLIERLNVLAERYVRKHLEPAGREARASAEHRALLAAWLKADAKAVSSLSVKHVEGTLADLRRELNGSLLEEAEMPGSPSRLGRQPRRKMLRP